jgi:hypothetical protein
MIEPQAYRKIEFIHRRGLAVDRPAADSVLVGTLYFSTDTGALDRSDGTTWFQYASAGGGTQGPQGPQGIQGEQGEQGIQGEQGEVGPTGPQGDKGDKGDTGDIGPQGPQGEPGIGGNHHVTHETGGVDAITSLSGEVLTSGTVADARLSANIPKKDQINVYTDYMQFNQITPQVVFYETDALPNEHTWRFYTNDGIWNLQPIDDAFNILKTPISVARTGVVTIPDGLGATPLNASQLTSGTVPDARISAAIARTGVVQTTTLVGTQNNLVLSANCNYLRCNNASALTITGMSAGFDGQIVNIVSIGAGQVNLSNNSGSSSVGNKLINLVTSVDTPLAAATGKAIYQYDLVSAVWRLIDHEQGAVIAYTPLWQAFLSSNTLGNGTVVGSYLIHGKLCDVSVSFTWGSTSVGGANFWCFTLPIPINGISPSGVGVMTLNTGAANVLVSPTITLAGDANGRIIFLLMSNSSNVGTGNPSPFNPTDFLRGAIMSYPI